MVDMKKKYDDLVEKAQLIRSVGNKLADLVANNESSIDWYREYLAKKVEENPDFDCSYTNEQIDQLADEIALIQDIEDMFWKKHTRNLSADYLPF